MNLGKYQSRRGSVVMIAIWTIAAAALITAATQLLAFRQATLGRLAVERVQARWAARGGVESTLMVMANHTETPIPGDANAMVREMDLVSFGRFLATSYDIRHTLDGQEWVGPMDEQGKYNVNNNSQGVLLALEDMTFDVADAISDWIDEDDEAGLFGVEREYYEGLNPSYLPRNGAIRNIAELELVAGVWPDYLRGEDWNLNGRIDPNENDGGLSLPVDKPDGLLNAGWSAYLTASSVDGGATASGLPRLYLRYAEPADLVDRVGVDEAQAASLIYFGRRESNRLDQLNSIQLNRVDSTGNASNQVVNSAAAQLTEDQLRLLMDEVSLTDPLDRKPGKINLNTVSPQFFRDLMTGMNVDEFVIDEILYLRDRPEGITSILDLDEIPDLPPQVRETLIAMFTTASNVYTISSKGRAEASGLEVEIVAVVDRSSLPIRIIEYREQ